MKDEIIAESKKTIEDQQQRIAELEKQLNEPIKLIIK